MGSKLNKAGKMKKEEPSPVYFHCLSAPNPNPPSLPSRGTSQTKYAASEYKE